jgi:hypothetical protein
MTISAYRFNPETGEDAGSGFCWLKSQNKLVRTSRISIGFIAAITGMRIDWVGSLRWEIPSDE